MSNVSVLSFIAQLVAPSAYGVLLSLALHPQPAMILPGNLGSGKIGIRPAAILRQ
jgi:hypothetical protein